MKKITKLISMLLSILMVLGVFTVVPVTNNGTPLSFRAEAKEVWTSGYCGYTGDGSNGQNLSYQIDEDTGVLSISGAGKMTEASPFKDDLRICSVVIDEGVTSIGKEAFSGCTNLVSVDIPSTVSAIGKKAFSHCTSLNNVVIPAGVTAIAERTFEYCSSLSQIQLPGSLEVIGSYSFSSCTALQQISLPQSLTTLSEGAFRESGLTGFSLPSNIKTIPYSCFANTYISDIHIPGTVETVGNNAFSGMKAPVDSITLDEGVKSIGVYCFSSYNPYTIVNTVKEVQLPDSLETMGLEAIAIPTIEKAYLGKNIREFNQSIPENGSVQEIEISEENPCFHSYDGVVYNSDYSEIVWLSLNKSGVLTFPKQLKGFNRDYRNQIMSRITQYAIEDGAENFAVSNGILYSKDMKTLYRCPMRYANAVVIPDTVTKIQKYAFCWTDIKVTLNNNLKEIGDYAFCGNHCRTSLVLPNSVESIGDHSFYGSYFTSVILSDSLEVIPLFAFGGCEYLQTVHIGAAATLSENSFGGGEIFGNNLSTITVSADNPSYSAYNGCLFNKDLSEFIYAPPAKQLIDIPVQTSSFYSYPGETKAIRVSDDNPYFSSLGRFLLNKEGTTLYRVQYTSKNVTVPDGVVNIGTLGNMHIPEPPFPRETESISFPSTVKVAGKYVIPDGAVITYSGISDSTYLRQHRTIQGARLA